MRLEHVRSRRKLPFGSTEVTAGRLAHLTHWDVAAKLLDHGRAASPGLVVTFTKQRYTEVGADCFIVHGDDTSIAPVVVDLTEAAEGDDEGAVASSADESDGVDWGRGMLPKARRKSSAGAAKKHAPSSAEANVFVEAHPPLYGAWDAAGVSQRELEALDLFAHSDDDDDGPGGSSCSGASDGGGEQDH